jgi:hypothetical protein
MTLANLSSWNPKVRALYEHWLSIHPGGGKLPGRRDFDPMAVPQLLPHIMLLEVEGRPPRFRYRVIGTRMVDALGKDLTGQWLDEAHSQAGRKPEFPGYELVVRNREPQWRRGAPHFASYIDKCTGMERVFLPLASNGVDVDMILIIAMFFDRDGHEL